MKQETPSLLIIGASCRAAAWSARRAGFRVAALDLFADRDLREIAEAHAIRSFPDSIVEQAHHFPDHQIVLAGGMENHPSVVAELEKQNAVVGASSSQIITLRSIASLQRWIQQASIPCVRFPKTISENFSLPSFVLGDQDHQTSVCLSNVASEPSPNLPSDRRQNRWLWKSMKSAGGLGVEYWNRETQLNFNDGYLEEKIEGECIGLVVLCSEEGTHYIGATFNRSYGDFHYGGSEGPIELSLELIGSVEAIMSLIAVELDYRGLLQADFIKTPTNELYLLEINPRWSASMEILELSTGRFLMAEHLGEVTRDSLVDERKGSLPNGRYIKRIVYATSPGTVSSDLSNWMMSRAYDPRVQSGAGWADIPMPGTQFQPQNPIATILVGVGGSEFERGNSDVERLIAKAHQMLTSE